MFVRCPGCQTTYRLGADRVPAGGLRLRCPGCGNAFRVREPGIPTPPAGLAPPTPTALPVPTPAAPGTARPAVLPPALPQAPTTRPLPTPEATLAPRPASEASTPVLGLERDDRRPPRPVSRPTLAARPTPPPAPRPAPWQGERTLDLGAPKAPAPRLETAPFQPGLPSAPPRPAAESTPAAQERARRLARALVSDILVYNQDRRDRALHEGNLASALGAEVNRAWDLYKSKVDAPVLRSTSYFKDALNEILAGGQRLF